MDHHDVQTKPAIATLKIPLEQAAIVHKQGPNEIEPFQIAFIDNPFVKREIRAVEGGTDYRPATRVFP